MTGADLLVALFSEQESHAVYLLKQQDITRLDVLNFVAHGISKVQQEEQPPLESDNLQEEEQPAQPGTAKSPLETYASNLNESARRGLIDPLIGRQPEVERTIQILCRRRKNNPLYVGEAGVGKTAIAEGLARMIVEGQVPEVLEKRNNFV